MATRDRRDSFGLASEPGGLKMAACEVPSSTARISPRSFVRGRYDDCCPIGRRSFGDRFPAGGCARRKACGVSPARAGLLVRAGRPPGQATVCRL